MTRAKQSDVFRLCVSRLPITTIRYFALMGFPCSSFFMTDNVCVGSALPVYLRSDKYSLSLIYSQAMAFQCNPKYSSEYASSQVVLSDGWRLSCCFSEVGALDTINCETSTLLHTIFGV